jgi:superfamily II DNA or RNA helicase
MLKQMKIPFRMLLTGTPLQNNIRELFNLLQFLDDTIDAEAMQEEYAVMTQKNITMLHDLIRPFILRRTKAQVLTFLPAMAQVILPVSMTVLQKRVYKSILTKKPELLRMLFSSDKTKSTERASFNNVLMQLRKCLCHPFVFSGEIEERNLHQSALHRNLVEASSKLQLLELLLPKLKERGHRVLIFSQFLDMLSMVEDFLDGLEMKYQRLDGTVNSLEKQKRIDEFNAENSPLFAFLLSTRAGGVGINLATADTVIIMDPDFNPHQDIQALSRAHRIGQTKKVLCFQMMTRASAEEKIMQIGRKKMALDHVVVEAMDAEDMEDKDVESILRYGAAELFNDDGEDKEIRYDDASIEKLLDRTQVEKTKSGADDSAESQFSLARVWANEENTLEDSLNTAEEVAPDPSVWQKILDSRARAAALEAATKADDFGRGKRSRMAVDYAKNEGTMVADDGDMLDLESSPVKLSRNFKNSGDSDTDFRAESSDGEPESEPGPRTVLEDSTALAIMRHSWRSNSSLQDTEQESGSQGVVPCLHDSRPCSTLGN